MTGLTSIQSYKHKFMNPTFIWKYTGMWSDVYADTGVWYMLYSCQHIFFFIFFHTEDCTNNETPLLYPSYLYVTFTLAKLCIPVISKANGDQPIMNNYILIKSAVSSASNVFYT